MYDIRSRRSPAGHVPARYPGAVPFYREQVVPRLVALTCGAKGLAGLRAQTADGLRGRVVEIGFGSGFNVPHYPEEVERVLAVEPSATAFRMAGDGIGASAVPVGQVGLDGRILPLDDASCDAALCTFALCTIPDVEVAFARSSGCSAPVDGSTSSSTAWPRTPGWRPSSTGSNPSSAGSPTGAT